MLGVLVVGGVLVAVFARREREPEYGGKKLSEWVRLYSHLDRNPSDIANAIQHLGTNAIPYLLKWISYDTPSWKAELYGALNSRLPKVNRRWRLTDAQAERAEDAAEALQFVGPDVVGALPDLTKMINNANAKRSSARAAEALGRLGTVGRQPLLAAMNTAPAWVAGYIIGFLGTNASPGIPPLLRGLEDPDPTVRARASNVLRGTFWDPAEN